MLLLAAGCVTSPPIFASKTDCTTLLPAEWREGVGNAAAPATVARGDFPEGPAGNAAYADALARSWMAFAVAQTGQVRKADDRYDAAIGIMERCGERDRQAIERSKPKFLGIF